MMPGTQFDEHAIFSVAIKITDPVAREAYLSQVCDNDSALFDRVSALLQANERNPRFMEDRPPALSPTVAIADLKNQEGSRLGNYKLLQQIGEGGFGIVYMAEQDRPVRRKVALKIIKPGMDSKEVVARFEAERQALALMDHPNIARVLDAGATDGGMPYFVMELVKGMPITEYCDKHKLSTTERLQLFAKVCRAVQHAHQKGIIHRDLKPSNILVTHHDGEPVPKVIDFGVAKALSQELTERTMFTRFGQVIGTPQYMSPEQADMNEIDVDTRTDIYSLGVVLYELLTGRPPFTSEELSGKGFDEMRRIIREECPRRPSCQVATLEAQIATTIAERRKCKFDTLRRLLAGELDWIVMKALEKDRSRRYETAMGLGEDVERYLSNEPVIAGPPSLSYKLRKAFARHRVEFTAASLMGVALIIGFGVAVWGWGSAQTALANEKESRREVVAEKEKAVEQTRIAIEEANNARETMSIILDLLSKFGTSPKTGRELTVNDAFQSISGKVLTEMELRPETAIELNLALARAFWSEVKLTPALKHYSKSKELLEAQSASDLRYAECLRYVGFSGSSQQMLELAVSIEQKAEATDELAKTLAMLAQLKLKESDLEEAEKLAMESVQSLQDSVEGFSLEELPQFILAEVSHQRNQVEQSKSAFEIAVSQAKQAKGEYPVFWWMQVERWAVAGHEDIAQRALMVADSIGESVDTISLRRLGINCRNHAKYRIADEIFIRAEAFGLEGKDASAAYSPAQRARLRVDLHAYEEALPHIDRAIQLSPDDIPDHYWLEFEKGLLLRDLGRDEEAKQHFRAAYDYCDPVLKSGRLTKVGVSNVRTARDISGIELGLDLPLDEWIDQLSDDNPAAAMFGNKAVRAEIRAQCYEALEQLDLALQEHRFVAMERTYSNEAYSGDWHENRLLELGKQLEKSKDVVELFTELVAKRDRFLPVNHPGRAFTRERLARAILQDGEDTAVAYRLLDEAIEILNAIEMVPQAEISRLKLLRDQINK